ncbi:MAG: hypothetical protein QM564_11175 [Bergeyella sp.]
MILNSNRNREKFIQISLIVMTLVMIILRFLLNEKGRTNPDSIRFMRTSEAFPVIDNTVTPMGYPLSLKFLTLFGLDEFWASKVIGIGAYLFIVWFAWKKKFYLKEAVLIGGLVSYVSIFSYTMSEPLMLPFVFVFLYISRNVIVGNYSSSTSLLYLSLMLILMYNIRYSALFFMGGASLYGIISWRKKYGKAFFFSGITGMIFMVLYKFLFIDYFNEQYVEQFLNIGLHPTSKLLVELFQGLTTSFNPFIHIANPGGGMINYGIYGIGALNILLIIFLFIKNPLSETEKYFVLIGVTGILCSYFVQYFYSVNAIDYRLLSPFILSLWIVEFKKLYQIFGKLTYGITVLSLLTGFTFSWLSKGNYLENRKEIRKFLAEENLETAPLKFYVPDEKDLPRVKIAELVSTVNPRVSMTFKPEDTLQRTTLYAERVLRKIKIQKNKYQ